MIKLSKKKNFQLLSFLLVLTLMASLFSKDILAFVDDKFTATKGWIKRHSQCEYDCLMNNKEFSAILDESSKVTVAYLDASKSCKTGKGYEINFECQEKINAIHEPKMDAVRARVQEKYREFLPLCEKKCDGSGIDIIPDNENKQNKLSQWFNQKAKTDIKVSTGAFITIDGEKVPFTKNVELKPGAVIEIEEDNGEAIFALPTGEFINISGKGTKVEIVSPDSVTQEEWKNVLNRYTQEQEDKQAQEGTRYGTTIRKSLTIHSGSMVFKYETGHKKGLWNWSINDAQGDDSASGSVFFTRVIDRDENNNQMVAAMFDNHSTVEYIKDPMTNTVLAKVYEGEAIAYIIDLTTSDRQEVARAATGEAISFTINDSGQATDFKTGTFNIKDKSGAVTNLEKSLNKGKYLTIGLIIIAITGTIIFLKKRKH